MRILIADDWPNVQNALRLLLEQQPRLKVVGEVADAEELLARIEADCPDVVLLGWELPGLAETDVLSTLREICPDTSVVVLSGRSDARRAALAMEADAFVSKVAPPERLLATIESLEQMGRADRSLGRRAGQPGSSDPGEQQHRLYSRPTPGDRAREIGSWEGNAGNICHHSVPSHTPTLRRSTMVEGQRKRKDTLKYVAITALAAVLLACIAAGLTVSLVLISEIPFQHIFPH